MSKPHLLDSLDHFLNHLNAISANIEVTTDPEQDSQPAGSRSIGWAVNGKPTIYLDASSHHHPAHKGRIIY